MVWFFLRLKALFCVQYTIPPPAAMYFSASAEIRVELYKIGLLRTINIYFLVIETFLNNVI